MVLAVKWADVVHVALEFDEYGWRGLEHVEAPIYEAGGQFAAEILDRH
jgi:hypothetical protein